MNIEQILGEVARGSERAFKELFYLCKDNIYHTALKLSKDEFIADEVLQETFVIVWNKRDSLLEINDFEAWLYRIAKNVFLARLRSKSLPTEPIDLYLHELINPAPAIDPAEYKELEKHFEIAIGKLPEKQRLTYQFIKAEGMSRNEVAKLLQVSPETVKSNYEEATNRVRGYMIKYLKDSGLSIILLYLLKK
ncbi:RNA polymerase sigma-70 factor, ECF subfamily [Sphingobacterium nematocida]|uniref:RNA polymerase sigma factor n=1 Tax=Sphingobacterium nematocida TaxID=1513896 RepID=A0A1T5AUH4_9SPHI|nr:sigma-70 family RNA polymerase sigma factor [Sphingobacterium nematocida]SKB38654.1 RNA polymerase sigma-70 factor, ECF subfamily [Sphingobacterium nematocida]